LHDFALARLRLLFPGRFELIANAAPVSTRCAEKGCCFPAMSGHSLCRGHVVDLSAQFSVLPSYAGEMVGPLHLQAKAKKPSPKAPLGVAEMIA
jgi:hypothetical protein